MMEAFISIMTATAVEEARCDAFYHAYISTATCRKDPIMSEYIRSVQLRVEAVKECSTKIVLVCALHLISSLYTLTLTFWQDATLIFFAKYRKTLPSGKNSDFIEISQEFLGLLMGVVDIYVYIKSFKKNFPDNYMIIEILLAWIRSAEGMPMCAPLLKSIHRAVRDVLTSSRELMQHLSLPSLIGIETWAASFYYIITFSF